MNYRGARQTPSHLSLSLALRGSRLQVAIYSRDQLRKGQVCQNQGLSILTVGCQPRQSQACSSQHIVGLMFKFLLPDNSSPLAHPAPNPQLLAASLRSRVALGVAVRHAEEVPQLLLVFWLLQCDNRQGKYHHVALELRAEHKEPSPALTQANWRLQSLYLAYEQQGLGSISLLQEKEPSQVRKDTAMLGQGLPAREARPRSEPGWHRQ